jgi:GxxExxY protein
MEFEKIIEICINILAELKTGFNEVVYQKALELELRLLNVSYESERVIPIIYKELQIGFGRADIIINNEIILELKAVGKLNIKATDQLENYLKFTGLKKGIVINFSQSDGNLEYIEVKK